MAQDLSGAIERCRREISEVEGRIRAGHPDIEGLCLALADWSAELRILLVQKKESRRGGTPAADTEETGRNQALIE